MSEKTKARNDRLRPHREWLKEAAGGCMVCFATLPPKKLDVHEATAGSHRQAAMECPWVQIVCCRECHEAIQGTPFVDQAEILEAWIRHSFNECLGRIELEV